MRTERNVGCNGPRSGLSGGIQCVGLAPLICFMLPRQRRPAAEVSGGQAAGVGDGGAIRFHLGNLKLYLRRV